jgi:hypothetical protein
MRSLVHTALLLALAVPAIAQEPTEEQKHDALMRAYHQNGDSMVRWGSLDIEDPINVETNNVTPEPQRLPPRPIPPAKPRKPPETVIEAEREDINTCTRHHMHKVLSNGGKSWHCKK